jgi:hypothetical protein
MIHRLSNPLAPHAARRVGSPEGLAVLRFRETSASEMQFRLGTATQGPSVPVAANVGYRAAKWTDEGQLRVIDAGSAELTSETPIGGRRVVSEVSCLEPAFGTECQDDYLCDGGTSRTLRGLDRIASRPPTGRILP